MERKVNNETEYKKALDYFKDSNGTTEVKQSDPNLTGIKGNIYGLYVNGTLKYIGERQCGKLTNRLNNHLKGCSDGTKSKHAEVTKAYASGNIVSYKTLLIEQDYERYSLETYLIKNIDTLEWNIRDKGGKKTKVAEISPTDDIDVEIDADETTSD